MLRSCCFLIFLLLPSLAFAQAKRALNSIEKLKYDQAEDLLYKSISKESVTPGEKYVLSILLFTEDYYNYNVDSAHHYALSAISDYNRSDEKIIEKLQKDEITEEDLVDQKNKIEVFTYNLARKENTEEAYNEYLKKYSDSLLEDSVILFRNKVAFEHVSELDSWRNYQMFMQKYPESNQYSEAKNRYEKLIYEDKVRDGKLSSLENFLIDNPDTPFREETEKAIFDIITGPHHVNNYMAFMDKYPKSHLSQLSAARIYHIAESSGKIDSLSEFIYKHIDKDSLERLEKKEESILFPILENSVYNFLNESGDHPFDKSVSGIPLSYRCGNIKDPLILVYEGEIGLIINRSGKVIFSDQDIDDVEDLGYGFILFKKGGKNGLLLKSGELILPPTVDEIRILHGQYIAFRDNDLWGITSVNKISLYNPQFSNVDEFSSLTRMFNKRGDQFALIQPDKLYPKLDQEEVELDFRYDDAEILSDELILTYSGNKQSLITNDLKIAVPEEEQELIKIDKGLLIENKDGFRFISTKIEINPTLIWEDMDFNSSWITLKGPNGYILLSQQKEELIGEYIDSVRLLNPSIALTYKKGVRSLYFENGSVLKLNRASQFEVVSSPPAEKTQQTFYLLIKEKKSKWLINAKADTLLVDYFTEVRAFGPEYLVVSGRNGSGLFDFKGNLLLKPQYDGIANYKNGGITVLNDGNLGFYRLADTTFIPPVYQKSIRTFNNSLFIAFFDGGYGLITNKNLPITEFEYDDIDYFNDSIAWVKKEESWHLYNFVDNSFLYKDISSYYHPDNTAAEYLYFQSAEGKGVLNNKTGTVIKATFNEIVNVGSMSNPVFMAEKYIEEADYFVVVYYDKTGNMLHRQAYTAEDYTKLNCEN